MSTDTIPIAMGGADREVCYVRVLARFSREIDGQTFEFAVTMAPRGLHQNITHIESGKKVCALSVGAPYLKAYAQTRSYTVKANLALDQLIDINGAARVRAVLAGAPALNQDGVCL